MTVVMAMEKVRTRKRGVDHQGVVIKAKIPALRENMEKATANLAAPLDT
jgi:flagellar assembly factor FliW